MYVTYMDSQVCIDKLACNIGKEHTSRVDISCVESNVWICTTKLEDFYTSILFSLILLQHPYSCCSEICFVENVGAKCVECIRVDFYTEIILRDYKINVSDTTPQTGDSKQWVLLKIK